MNKLSSVALRRFSDFCGFYSFGFLLLVCGCELVKGYFSWFCVGFAAVGVGVVVGIGLLDFK